MASLVYPDIFFFSHYAKCLHGRDHGGKGAMVGQMKDMWFTKGFIVLMYMRMRKRTRVNLSPFEIVFGRPPFMGMEGGKQQLPSTDLCEHNMLNYRKEKSSLLSNVCVREKDSQGKPAETPLHNIKPGDYMVIRDLRRKSWKVKKLEPFIVLLTTHRRQGS